MRFDFLAVCYLCLVALFLPTPGLAQSASLYGSVRNKAGAPVAGAEVRLVTAGEEALVARATSDSDGSFAFEHLEPGEYYCLVEHAGYKSVKRKLLLSARSEQVLLIELEPLLPILAYNVNVQATAPRSAASSASFRYQEFSQRLIETPGDVLRIVPGLVIAQHAGGGKADQYMIRGFDADHGTDIALFFDGIPVNLVSHAHGQGYADLHFVIPETLEAIDVYKGPYFAQFGNLATGGAVQLRLRQEFERSFVRLQGGNFGTGRAVGAFSPKHDAIKGFLAIEGYWTDGPFRDEQNLRRWNLASRWTVPAGGEGQMGLLFTGYGGRWNASGQIPLRAVRAGLIDRFDSIDPSEGGDSTRFNFSIWHNKTWDRHLVKSQFYAVRYTLDLFSNFTFFLRDPVNGDGIMQRDRRWLWGGHFQHHNWHSLSGRGGLLSAGIDYRQDHIRGGLFNQRKRLVLSPVIDSAILERNVALYVEEELALAEQAKLIGGLRADFFNFDVEDRLGGGPAGRRSRAIVQPKLSLVLMPKPESKFEIYLNYGSGFHSNDARSAVAEPRAVVLPAASGYEVGLRRRFGDRFEVAFDYWLLDLEGELVWVGDEGTTELSGATRRHGPELELNWQINRFLWFDADLTYSRAFFKGSRDNVPRAPRLTFNSGLSLSLPKGLSGSFRLRHVGAHPLNEEGSARADGFTIADLNLRYPLGDRLELLLAIENLFDDSYKEAQAFFASRLPWEPEPVFDNHSTPGKPFAFRIGFKYSF